MDLLNYGAAAQTYFGYRTDALVNAGLTEEQRALATADYGVLTPVSDGADGGAYSAAITGKNIFFGNRIQLLFATDFGKDDDLTGIFLRVRYKDSTGQTTEKLISAASFVYRADADITGYVAYFDDLKASELRTELELTLIKDETEISATVRYSLDTYVSNRLKKSTDESFKELLEKTLLYSDSAKAYFSAVK